jgi:stearoyl-CoA desaturase (delta-9 desaturase)
LAKDKGMRRIHMLFLPMNIAMGAALTAAGYAYGGWPMAMSFLVWGMFVRLVFVLHSTWFVNSASHMFGYKNYETTDDSRNNWWVALVTYGEGWHNNHHAYPRLARHGHKWWEFDLTYGFIRMMKAVGLVWDVVDLDKGKRGSHIREAS